MDKQQDTEMENITNDRPITQVKTQHMWSQNPVKVNHDNRINMINTRTTEK